MFFIYSNLISTSDTICLSPGAFGRLRGLKKGKNVQRNHRVLAVFVEEVVIYCYVLHFLFLILEYSYDLMNISWHVHICVYIYTYISHLWACLGAFHPTKTQRVPSAISPVLPPLKMSPTSLIDSSAASKHYTDGKKVMLSQPFKAHHGHSF